MANGTAAIALTADSRKPSPESVTVTDQDVLRRCLADPMFPVLVSFPRTGSHWLRMLMELYFERPTLVRVFYYPEQTDYLLLHTHDLPEGQPEAVGSDVRRDNVIYLYRHPVHTIYSQLRFHGESLDDVARIQHWSELYGKNLEKWLVREKFTKRKTVVTYEALRRDLPGEFGKITDHFGVVLEERRLLDIAAKVTKEELHRLVGQERPETVNLDGSYASNREAFERDFACVVWEALLRKRSHLLAFFSHLEEQSP